MQDMEFVIADQHLKEKIVDEWKTYMPSVGKYIKLENGFTIVAMQGLKPVGLVAVSYGKLNSSLPPTIEAHIDDIEVLEEYRQNGIGRKLVELVEKQATRDGAYQLRSWSTNDKKEAIPMWKALGFGLCPVTHSMWGPEITGYFVAKTL